MRMLRPFVFKISHKVGICKIYMHFFIHFFSDLSLAVRPLFINFEA